MTIIPAVDIKDGACVRLVHGDPLKKTVYSEDPVEAARIWAKKGAKRIHVVDLDGAFGGRPKHLSIAGEIKKATGCVVEFGGGVRSVDTAEEAFALGIDKVVLGTAALEDTGWIQSAIAKRPDGFIAGIDSIRDVPATAGWKKGSEFTTEEALKKMEELGFREVIFTDILRDGTLEGPNLDAIRGLVSKTRMRMIASGGVSKLEDVKALKSIPGVEGVIIGKALYDGRVTLEECLKI
ncbi:MAG: 1-(5-phosphoribosyl)-5-[(5-phosphoribosylamino)methylideneamino]imidazole-4-carboxamide isomerase [Elusimicrobia bacterium RIFCSPLOWO2_01_FULL_60_11]|nr:MAG: 1-(5-phosphoribosyl)-5-[(5-phosphoribosylamino)methylideneamino]imidazole-4-carboxamide isomerase [Elusimicrobia bacterium RIFCSPLOWO2_01_FULL_60_11]